MKCAAVILLILTVPLFAGDTPKYEPRVVDQWYLAVQSMGDARSLQTAIGAYYLDHNRFPAAASIEELRGFVEPTSIRTIAVNDAWGTPFLYRVSADGQKYVIASAGSDKKFDESSWKAEFTMSSKDDLVYQQGGFEREWVVQRVCK